MDLSIRVQPRASRNEIVGERGGRVLVRVTAPPLDGRANVAACETIARTLGLPRRQVAVIRGARSRDKTVRIECESHAERTFRELLGFPTKE